MKCLLTRLLKALYAKLEELKKEREAEERLNKALDELLDKIIKDSRL